MTRLTEALERARALPPNESGVQAGLDHTSRPEVPRDWDFDVDPPADWSPKRPSDFTTTAVPELRSTEPAGSKTPASAQEYRFGDAIANKLVVGLDTDRAVVEQYRRLAAVLHHAQAQRGIRRVMVASAVAAEGKTLTATNLALTLSHSYQRRVLLIDADLRRPNVHNAFRLSNRVGLSDTLRSFDRAQVPIRQVSSTLWVLPAGRMDPDPMSGLVSDRMKELLADAAEKFDWVIVDTPPVALMTDANLLAATMDAAVMVVSAGSTPYPLVKRSIEAIGASRVLGVVLNRAARSTIESAYDYYGYYNQHPTTAAPEPRRFGRGLFKKHQG